ncbi:piggyBac transposable element-derived protein 4 [Trichonephila clavipes]|nr:piggyBac transposable element-derived protein 4 [Trichonephila clavipes]
MFRLERAVEWMREHDAEGWCPPKYKQQTDGQLKPFVQTPRCFINYLKMLLSQNKSNGMRSMVSNGMQRENRIPKSDLAAGLADILVREKTDTYGTVNKTRKDLPINFSKEKVPKGEIVAYQRGRLSSTPNPLRLTARHFASHIPPNPIKREPRRQYAVCCSRKDANGKKIRKETRIWCKDCEEGTMKTIIENWVARMGSLRSTDISYTREKTSICSLTCHARTIIYIYIPDPFNRAPNSSSKPLQTKETVQLDVCKPATAMAGFFRNNKLIPPINKAVQKLRNIYWFFVKVLTDCGCTRQPRGYCPELVTSESVKTHSVQEACSIVGLKVYSLELCVATKEECHRRCPRRHLTKITSCQVIYSQFGLVIHQNDHQERRRFVDWAQSEIAVVPDFHKRILFSDEAHFWLNGYVNKQNCRIWSEANPQVYVETPLHPEKLTVWCALWAGGIIGPYFVKNDEGHNVTVNGDRYRAMITNFFIPELNNHDVQELWFQQDGATCHTARAQSIY